jgi:hypothetical protein
VEGGGWWRPKDRRLCCRRDDTVPSISAQSTTPLLGDQPATPRGNVPLAGTFSHENLAKPAMAATASREQPPAPQVCGWQDPYPPSFPPSVDKNIIIYTGAGGVGDPPGGAARRVVPTAGDEPRT